MAPVNQMMKGIKSGDMGKVYDSVYWGEKGSEYYVTKEEFLSESGGLGSISEEEDIDIVFVRTGKKFFFFSTWKIDNQSMESLF